MLAILGRALEVGAQEMLGDDRLAVVGGADHEQVAGPHSTGLGSKQALQQRYGLARAPVADPTIGRNTGQALGRRQARQLADFWAEMGELQGPRYQCEMSSKGRGSSTSSSSARVASSATGAGLAGSADL